MTLNVIFNMDCISGIIDRLPNFKFDLVLTDPPYNLSKGKNEAGVSNKRSKWFGSAMLSKGSWDTFETEEDFKEFTRSWLSICYKVLKDNGQIYINCTHHNLFVTKELLDNIGFTFRQILIWYSPNSPPSITGKVYSFHSEYILWATKGENYTFNNTKQAYCNLTRQISDTFVINSLNNFNPERVVGHPTQKPSELLMKLILVSTNEGELVLEPFLGSGSTMLSCIKINRHCFGFEKNPKYIPLIKKKVHWNQSPHEYYEIKSGKEINEEQIKVLMDKYSGLLNREQAMEMIMNA